MYPPSSAPRLTLNRAGRYVGARGRLHRTLHQPLHRTAPVTAPTPDSSRFLAVGDAFGPFDAPLRGMETNLWRCMQ